MARPIVLGNGELTVGLNNYGLVHDFSYPRIGKENHTIGKGLRHRVGVWVDGVVSWLDDGDWTIRFSYPHDSLIGNTVATHPGIGVQLEFDDCVSAHTSVFVRSIHVVNMSEHQRDIRLFMHQAFVIGDSRSNTDTAQYLPDSDALVHYRGRRVFVVSGKLDDAPFDQYSVGLFGIEGREGTYRDADDGELSGCTVEHGRVDSTIRFKMNLAPHDSRRVQYWIAAGRTFRDALNQHDKMAEGATEQVFADTQQWWDTWLSPVERTAEHLPEQYRKLFSTSAMMLRAHTDRHGAVVASIDSGMLNYGRDAYAYCWPRDGAYVMWPLIRLGYKDEPLRYFEFCRRVLHPSGYLGHKYTTDGALGSSWQSYVHEHGIIAPPIQEDETALTLFVFAQYYHIHKDSALLNDYYGTFVQPMGDFLAKFIDGETKLPRPSYELWEEFFTTSTYTTAVTYAALLAAADLADAMNDSDSAVRWRSAAEDIHTAAHKLLFNEEKNTFYKGVIHHKGELYYDDTVDTSSVFGVFMYGLFPVDGDHITRAVQTVRELFMPDDAIGLPRYENDVYGRVHPHDPSNYWHITTLWYAQYCIETGDIDEAYRILDWVTEHSYDSGVLAEQVRPATGESLSVAPLAWSHAEYMATLLDTISGDSRDG